MATYNEVLQLIGDNLAPASNITAQEHRDVEEAILNFARDQWLTGDIKEIDCTDAYIEANFDANGIGINERLGWAICNGYNGLTKNRTGRVSVAYGNTSLSGALTFSSVGTALTNPAIGGSKDAIVVSHSHYTTVTGSQSIGNSNSLYDGTATNRKELGLSSRAYDQSSDAFDYELTTSAGNIDAGKTNAVGSSGVDANMQPYIVTLFIQKL
jgi:hypothetical protein